MIPLVDIHCHLLAGLDDGPRTEDEALEMCRIAYDDGTRIISAGAHHNEDYPDNTPERIRSSAARLAALLHERNIPLSVFPNAEIRLFPEMESAWERGELLSIADRGRCLLVEMPYASFVDIRPLAERFRARDVTLVLAHPERYPELLHGDGALEDVVRSGCRVQVSASSVTHPKNGKDERALKGWFQRDLVHFLGSDGHSPVRRRPMMADAYNQIAQWVGTRVADRVCSTSGAALVHGLPFATPMSESPRRPSWIGRLLGQR